MNLLFANDRRGVHPGSFYASRAGEIPGRAALQGDKSCDVVVIGAGYTGLSAALQLAADGFSVIVLDAQRVGFGASGRNGGQVGTGFNKDQRGLEKFSDRATAKVLWEMSEDAKTLTRHLAQTHAPDADYQPGVIHADWNTRDFRHEVEAAEHLSNHYGYDQLQVLDRDGVRAAIGTNVYAGGILDMGAGHLDPLAYCLGLARAAEAAGVQIYENSHVTKITGGTNPTATTPAGRVRAKFMVLACNGYLGGLNAQVAARVMPINNFIIATEPLRDDSPVLPMNYAVADSHFVVNYFRKTTDGRLLYGGGENYGYKFPRRIEAMVRKPMTRLFPELRDVKVTHVWGGTLAITMSRLPFLSQPLPNVYSASGYSGQGVALAGLCGQIVAQAINGQAGRFDVMSALPAPRFPGGRHLRQPLLVMALTWFGLRDRLGL